MDPKPASPQRALALMAILALLYGLTGQVGFQINQMSSGYASLVWPPSGIALGMLIQNIAEDENRGPTAEAWVRTQAFFETIGEDELLDPTISAETLLFRLFHEDGVRVFDAQPLKAFCRCSKDRIESVLTSFSPEERADMVEDDGLIKVTCEYCSSTYSVDPARLTAAA